VKIKKVAAGYSIFVGISMIGMWTMFYCTGGIPELNTKPAEIILHILGEIITAVLLITGGYALFAKKGWGSQIYSLSMGMLLYTLIVSPGYYIQRGETPFMIMFSILFLISVFLIIVSVIKRKDFFN